MKRLIVVFLLVLCVLSESRPQAGGGDQGPTDPNAQMGKSSSPNYELFRTDKVASQGDPGYSGALNLSIPLLVVPGRHGHDFQVTINYNSNVTQREEASWVGLGWSLDIGAVERTVMGRCDDQQDGLGIGCNLGADAGNRPVDATPWRAEKVGWLHPDHSQLVFPPGYGLSTEADFDLGDMYNLIIDGGNHEMMALRPPAVPPLELPGPYRFCTTPYMPWSIVAGWPHTSGPIFRFTVTKENGDVYVYGPDHSCGATDNVTVEGVCQYAPTTRQKYSFPYRWSLARILYADGSTTSITYNFHNAGINRVGKRYESIMIDRSYAWQENVFGAGFLDYTDPSNQDQVFYEYSSPDTLYTDTHYLVFRSDPQGDDGTARNRKLTRLILFNRFTNTPIRQVAFWYAARPNTNDDAAATPWVAGTRLKNNQLTLVGITLSEGAGAPAGPDVYRSIASNGGPGGNFQEVQAGPACLPPYEFTYHQNPGIDLRGLAMQAKVDPLFFTGYHIGALYGTAWRLKSMKLPTGATVEYAYQPLAERRESGFWVNCGPEGQRAPSEPLSYRAQPSCRIIEKRVIDPLGPAQVTSYVYGEAIYDAPSRPTMSSYRPRATYINALTQCSDPMNFSRIFRSCPIGHRWVRATLPDSSSRTEYYTSSYQDPADPTLDPRESRPDWFSAVCPADPLVVSHHGSRGLVWKEVAAGKDGSPTQVTENFFSCQEQFLDHENFQYGYYPLAFSAKVTVSYAPYCVRLDSTCTVRDGVMSDVHYSYYDTPLHHVLREGSTLLSRDNGLLESKIERAHGDTRQTWYEYAFTHFPAMDSLFMLSQPYATTISFNGVDESKEWTGYANIAGRWLPAGKSAWNGSPGDTRAPVALDTPANVAVAHYTYDAPGYCNVVALSDANSNTTVFSYSSDSLHPFATDDAGLRAGNVTGMERLKAHAPGPFNLLAPDGSSASGTIGALTWGAANGATGYDVFLGTVNPPPFLCGEGGTTHNYDGLVPGVRYYWTVVARTTEGETCALNGPCSFVPTNAPGRFDLTFPANGAGQVPCDEAGLSLTWSSAARALTYEVCWSEDNPGPPWQRRTPVSGTRLDIEVRKGTVYYWNVIARNAVDSVGADSGPWRFSTEGKQLPGDGAELVNADVEDTSPVPSGQLSIADEGFVRSPRQTGINPADTGGLEETTAAPALLPALCTSYLYDLTGHIARFIDENQDTLRYLHDNLGRFIGAFGAGGVRLSRYDYYHNAAVDPSIPNRIDGRTFRSAAEVSTASLYYDGLGYEHQRQAWQDDGDIVTHTTYNTMRQVDTVYKPYHAPPGRPHEYDPAYALHANTYYPSLWGYAYSTNQYLADGTVRPHFARAPGSLFQMQKVTTMTYACGAAGTTTGVGPSGTIQTDGVWRTSGGTLHAVLNDGAAPEDATYACMDFPAGLYIGGVFTLRVGSPAKVTGTAFYRLLCRLKWVLSGVNGQSLPSGGGRGSRTMPGTVSQDGGGSQESINPCVEVGLLEGATVKRTWHVDLVSQSSGYQMQVFRCSPEDISDPDNLSIRISSGGISSVRSATLYLSWVRLETYYPDLFLTKVTDENGVSSHVFTDLFDNTRATVTDADSLRLCTTYLCNGLGKPICVTDPGGRTTRYTYTKRGFQASKSTPEAGTAQNLYDKNGNLRFTMSAAQAPGRFTYRKYDRINRLIEMGEYRGANFFTQICADSSTFPGSSNACMVLYRSFVFDDSLFSGQRNTKGRLSTASSYRDGIAGVTTHYSYDRFGRVEWLVHEGTGLSPQEIRYWYDWQGNVIRKSVGEYGMPAKVLQTFYSYDRVGRLSRVSTGEGEAGSGADQEAAYVYNAAGLVTRMLLGQGPAQTVDYTYNERDWSSEIHAVDTNDANSLTEELQYYQLDLPGGTPKYNGNIAAQKVFNSGAGISPRLAYGYRTDRAGRLTSGAAFMGPSWKSTPSYQLPQVTYDPGGNILTLHRNSQSGAPFDRLLYQYVTGTSLLSSITNTASGRQTSTYSYDADGNVTRDGLRGIDSIRYDLSNLPIEMMRADGSIIRYWYDANGNRIRRQQGGVDELYLLGSDGQTEAVLNVNGGVKFWNIVAAGQVIGRVEKQ